MAKKTNPGAQDAPKKDFELGPEDLTMLQLVEVIVTILNDSKLEKKAITECDPWCQELAKRQNLTPMQAMWLSMLINRFDDTNIEASDLARFLDCSSLRVLNYWSILEELADKGFIDMHNSRNDRIGIKVLSEVMVAFRNNTTFKPVSYDNIDTERWMDYLHTFIGEKDNDKIDFVTFTNKITKLKEGNKQLKVVQKLHEYQLDRDDEIVLLLTMSNLVQNNDEHIVGNDISDLLEEHWDVRNQVRAITRGVHELQKKGLIECGNEDGRVDTSYWHLTDKAKEELLSEIDITTEKGSLNGLIPADSITEKQLFFNAEMTKNVNRLTGLLRQEQFAKVQERLEKKGLRRGFACLFYGAPGTGKTETAYQLARETGRSIMMVDIPNMRSKWVGETEKNIKATFDRYRKAVKSLDLAPILLFNEADGILGKRNEASASSVDKMENAMQNIILQEMETLDGIMIATTNLTNNLDKAFERRFLYKLEFAKPTPSESQHIWHALLPELNDSEAQALASKYAFSGGQIENIARKYTVDSILNDNEELDMNAIYEACSTELLGNKTGHGTIGFV